MVCILFVESVGVQVSGFDSVWIEICRDVGGCLQDTIFETALFFRCVAPNPKTDPTTPQTFNFANQDADVFALLISPGLLRLTSFRN